MHPILFRLCFLLVIILGTGPTRAGEPAVRIVLVGDSTMSSYTKPPADRPDLTGWGQVFGDFFDEVIVLNHARSGASTKSFIREGLWKKALDARPTYVFIQFGHNDSHEKTDRSTNAATDFQMYLKQFIDESRQAGAIPILVTPVARRTFKSDKLYTLLQPYADATQKVGAEQKVPVIDLHKASFDMFQQLGDKDSSDLTAAPKDRTHFSRKGAQAIARLVVERLPEQAKDLVKALKFPAELVRFKPYKNNPVFGPVKGEWDARIRERGWILHEEGIYKLWYTGYDGTREGIRRLGYATSPDGIQWTRYPKNPLLREEWVEDMMIVKHESKYYMFAEGREDRAHWLVSSDGINWTELGKLDVRRKNGEPIPEGPYGTPTVWRDKDRWLLFYERNDLGVWLAESADMKVWKHVQDEPVLSPGPGEYDKDMIAMNQIVKHHGRYYAYYHGGAKAGAGAGLWSTCVATSKDLIHWEKYPGNPLLPVRENKSSGIVIQDGQGYRLYTMHPEVNLHLSVQRNSERAGASR